jgi:hypothetical protein
MCDQAAVVTLSLVQKDSMLSVLRRYEGWLRIAGILRLLFSHRVDQPNATQDHSGDDNGLTAECHSNAPLDCAMILLNTDISISALPYHDRL